MVAGAGRGFRDQTEPIASNESAAPFDWILVHVGEAIDSQCRFVRSHPQERPVLRRWHDGANLLSTRRQAKSRPAVKSVVEPGVREVRIE